MHESIIYSVVRRVCLHINPCITKCTDIGILTKPYINLKALRTDCNLLLMQQTQTAANL